MSREARRAVAWILGALLSATAAAFAGTPQAPAAEGEPAWLGVFLDDAVDGGVRVMAVVAGGPAELAGLRKGDIVVAAAEAPVVRVEDLVAVLGSLKPGDRVALEWLRGGSKIGAEARLGRRTALAEAPLPAPPEVDAADLPLVRSLPRAGTWGERGDSVLGARLTELTPELRRHFGAPDGAGLLVIRVRPQSLAERAGVRVGDVLVRVGDRPVASTEDLSGLLDPGAGGEGAPTIGVVRARAPLEMSVGTPTVAPPVPPGAPRGDHERAALASTLRKEIARLEQRIRELRAELDAVNEAGGE